MSEKIAPLSPEQFRKHFVALDDAPHFASCSQGALSNHLAHTMQRMVGGLIDEQAPWGAWVGTIEKYRSLAGDFLGVDSDNIAILSCASEAAFQVVTSLDWSGERNRLVTSDLEFPSIGNVWRAQQLPIEIVNVEGIEESLFADNWIALIDERTKLVSIPLVSYINGYMPEINRVIEHAHSVGALVFVDAYQGAGIVPINAAEMNCDYLATGNLKYMLGLPGIAMLYVKNAAEVEVPAGLTGWFGRSNPFNFDPKLVDYPNNARRFEMGTQPIPSAYAGVAGFEMLQQVDSQEMWEHVQNLREYLAEQLIEAGFNIDYPADPKHRGPQIAVLVDNPDELAAKLAEYKIGTSPRGQRLRLSLHGYSNKQDIDTLIKALKEVA